MPPAVDAPTSYSVPAAAMGDSSRNGESRSMQHFDPLADQQLAALVMAGDVLFAAAGAARLPAVCPSFLQLLQDRLAIVAEVFAILESRPGGKNRSPHRWLISWLVTWPIQLVRVRRHAHEA